ncbi:hypothetical protein H4R33_003474 [Dimargaris cristalligena]|nr:hypothetical protein H4R33_003474 [Dimargaris cristalligena]
MAPPTPTTARPHPAQSDSEDSDSFEDAREFPAGLENSLAAQAAARKEKIPIKDLAVLNLHANMPLTPGGEGVGTGSASHNPVIPPSPAPSLGSLGGQSDSSVADSSTASVDNNYSNSTSKKKHGKHGLKGFLRRQIQSSSISSKSNTTGSSAAPHIPHPVRSFTSPLLGGRGGGATGDRNNNHLPPEVKLDTDIREVNLALEMFLNSRLQEAEDLAGQLKAHSLYGALGYSLIRFLKATMTFEDDNIRAAIDALSLTFDLAGKARKDFRSSSSGYPLSGSSSPPTGSTPRSGESGNSDDMAPSSGKRTPSRVVSSTSFVAGLGSGVMDTLGGFLGKNSGWQAMKSMNRCQLHAELIHAEATLLRAVLNIYSEDGLLSFLKEGLHVRSSYLTYRDFGKFLDWADRPENAAVHAKSIDQHLVSGVALGLSIFNLILSLLPSKYLRIVEIFGFTGDRDRALAMLEVAGGWRAPDPLAATTAANDGPFKPAPDQDTLAIPDIYACPLGLRRVFCDLVILFYHTVFASAFPVKGVNIGLSQRIMRYHLERHPNSVLFMYFASRTHQILAEIPAAIVEYEYTITIQKEWVQLQHLCYWELVINHFALLQFNPQATRYLTMLLKESRWSKAVYTYVLAASYYNQSSVSRDPSQPTAVSPKMIRETMHEVSQATQKIGGKSIPIEKFVARKARKFFMQNQKLLLPAFEMMIIWSVFNIMPRPYLWLALSTIDEAIAQLESIAPPPESASGRNGGNGESTTADGVYYYDDLCLAYLLRGVVCRELACPTSWLLLSNHGILDQSQRAQTVGRTGSGHPSTNRIDPHANLPPIDPNQVDHLVNHLNPISDARISARIAECERRYAPSASAAPPNAGAARTKPTIDEVCIESFYKVFQYAYRVELDHYIFYMAHYQLGLYYLAVNHLAEATTVLEAVISGSGSHSFQVPTQTPKLSEYLSSPAAMAAALSGSYTAPSGGGGGCIPPTHHAPTCVLNEEDGDAAWVGGACQAAAMDSPSSPTPAEPTPALSAI